MLHDPCVSPGCARACILALLVLLGGMGASGCSVCIADCDYLTAGGASNTSAASTGSTIPDPASSSSGNVATSETGDTGSSGQPDPHADGGSTSGVDSTRDTEPFDSTGIVGTGSTDGLSGSDSTGGPSPFANDDFYTTFTNTPLQIVAGQHGLLDNDQATAAAIASSDAISTAGGTVLVEATGGFSYQPPPGFRGVDHFGYTLQDHSGAQLRAQASIIVNPATIPVTDLEAGLAGYALSEAPPLSSGYWVDIVGDLDGDGRDEIAMGLPYENPSRVLVAFGKADTSSVDLADPFAQTGGYWIEAALGHQVGEWVTEVDDMNGDGRPELMFVGTDENIGFDHAYVAFGKADGSLQSITDLDAGVGGFRIDAAIPDDGAYIASLGDLNGDGRGDVAIGALNYLWNDPNEDPLTFVVFGKADGVRVDLGTLPGSGQGWVIDHSAVPGTVVSAASAGDVNGDGIPDIIVGAGHTTTVPGAPFPAGPFYHEGPAYVVFGKADALSVDLSLVAQGVGGFLIDGSALPQEPGATAGATGDVNGDGLADVVVTTGSTYSGGGHPDSRFFVVFGKVDGLPVDLADIDAGLGGYVVDPEGGVIGTTIDFAGDVNGDGAGDMILRGNGCLALVVYGKASGSTITGTDLASGVGGFTIDMCAPPYDGAAIWTTSGGGDINGDGYDDLVVSSGRYVPAASGYGYLAVVAYGQPSSW